MFDALGADDHMIWLWAAGIGLALLVLFLVLRAVWLRPFDPREAVDAMIEVVSKSLESGPAAGAQSLFQKGADLVADATGPGAAPVTQVLAAEAKDILWRQWRDAKWGKRSRLPGPVWRAALAFWRARGGDILLSVEEIEAAGFNRKAMTARFREKLASVAKQEARGEDIENAVWRVVGGLYDALALRPNAQAAGALIRSEALAEGQSTLLRQTEIIDERTSQMHGALAGLAEDVGAVKQEMVRDLELAPDRELTAQQIRRLPTALVVADYNVIPYLDHRGLEADLLAWAQDERSAVAGRLYAAAGGYGKTRLALRAVKLLRERGWRAGLLSRHALETQDVRGQEDSDVRLRRFFAGRGAAGAFLALDYAEGRQAQVERVARAALAAGPGGPIRIVLLARSAGPWWDDLQRDSRDVQLAFESAPIAAMSGDIPEASRAEFFDAAVAAFADALGKAQDLNEPLLAPDWSSRSRPDARIAAAATPLAIAFEAYLHIRGVDVQTTPLEEMAREERRHWRRALKLGASDSDNPTEALVDAMHRCAAALTLRQGSEVGTGPKTDEELDATLRIALDRVPLRDATSAGLALRDLTNAIAKLYRLNEGGGERLRPVLPDLLGEHVCGSLGDSLSVIMKGVVDLPAREAIEAVFVSARMLDRRHESRVRDAATAAIVSTLAEKQRRVVQPLMHAARTSSGDLAEVLTSAVKTLPVDVLNDMLMMGRANSPALHSLRRSVTQELLARDSKRADATESQGPEEIVRISFGQIMQSGSQVHIEIGRMTHEAHAKLDTALLKDAAAQHEDDPRRAKPLIDDAIRLFEELHVDYPKVALSLAMAHIGRVGIAAGLDKEQARQSIAESKRLLDAMDPEDGHFKAAALIMWAVNVLHSIEFGVTKVDVGDLVHETLEASKGLDPVAGGEELEQMVRFYENAALVDGRTGNPERGAQIGKLAVDLAEKLAGSDEEQLGEGSVLLSKALLNWSVSLLAAKRFPEALKASERALEIARKLAQRHPEQFEFAYAKALDNITPDYRIARRPHDALTVSNEAIAILEKRGSAANPAEQEDLAAAYLNMSATLLEIPPARSLAQEYFDKCEAIYSRLESEGRVRYSHMAVFRGRIAKALSTPTT